MTFAVDCACSIKEPTTTVSVLPVAVALIFELVRQGSMGRDVRSVGD